jgi:2-polyprenyl-3-methyl-5-hydroxy-6-metoxy-1,4-benzoquinol methylase
LEISVAGQEGWGDFTSVDRRCMPAAGARTKDVASSDAGDFESSLHRLISLCVENCGPELNANYLAEESLHSQRKAYEALLRNRRTPGTRALELGAGTGLMGVGLALSGWDVTGVDLYDDRSQALGRWAGAGHRYEYLRRDLEAPSYGLEPGAFDAAFIIDSIEHVKNVRVVLENAHAALRPGGLLILTTPNYARLNTRLKALRTVLSPEWPIRLDQYVAETPYIGHVREFTGAEMVQVFRQCGLRPIDLHYFSCATGKRALTVSDNSSMRRVIRASWQVQRFASRIVPALSSSFVIVGRKR